MRVAPGVDAFRIACREGRPQVVWTELIADLDTPVAAMLKLAHGKHNCFLLESVEGGAIRGRYSFIGINPDVLWRAFGNRAEINTRALADPHAFTPCPIGADAGAIASLRALVRQSLIELPPGLPPMAAGLVGYLGYDVVRLVERLPDANPDVLGVPDALFVRPTLIAVFDTISDKITMVTPVWPEAGADPDDLYLRACARLDAAAADLARPLPPPPVGVRPPAAAAAPVSNIDRDAYLALVERAKAYILAGDIFQVVPSQRFAAPFPLPPFCLYRALRRLNPSPFLFHLDFDGFAVVGSSPEIMVRVRDGDVTIRPIAGTRPRGATAEADQALARDLLADPKERAEHLMLLDLGRNDVGRVARVGTVRVSEKMIIERYSHVMHIVSNVVGALDDRYDAIDALFAGFPAGTVSGAPKVRAMEIIDELEPERRGIYGGCIGYIGANGEVDTCIALRTAVVRAGRVYVQAGGGVVADSDPAVEWQETLNKAMALLRAAEQAWEFAPDADADA